MTKDLTYERFCSDWWPLELDKQPEKPKLIALETIDTGTWDALKKQMTLPKTEYETILEKHNFNNQ